MNTYQVLALLAFLFPLAYSPGPGNLFFAASGARFGLRKTLGATTGYHIATFGVTLPIGVGFSSAVAAAPEAFLLLKIAGSLYVLWLAWKLWRAGSLDSQQDAKPANFWDGALLLVLNPKAYIIIALMFSQFITRSSTVVDVVLISAIFTLNNLAAFTLWTVVGDRLARTYRNEDQSRHLNSVFGGLLAIVGFWMLLS